MPTQMPTHFPLPPREHRPPVTLLRTLFVAKSWSIPDLSRDPPICFTSIADALAQAATMTPSSESPVAIIISPGTYPGDIVLQSWVFLSGASTHQNAVTIDGTVTWAPNAAGFEAVQLYFLSIARPTTVTTAGKGMSVGQNNQTTFILHGCFPDGLTVQGRSNSGDNRDFVFAATSVPGPTITNVFTFDKCLVEWVASRLKGMTFNDCRFRIIGSTAVPPKDPAVNTTPVDWSVTGTSKGVCTGSNFTTGAPTEPAWILDSETSVEFAGCSLHSLTVAAAASATGAGATADIRTSECRSLSAPPGLGPKGTVNRRSLTMSIGPTTSADFPVKFQDRLGQPLPPFPDDAYSVALQLTDPAGTPGSNPRVITKTPEGFTIQNPGNNNTYDVTVIHD